MSSSTSYIPLSTLILNRTRELRKFETDNATELSEVQKKIDERENEAFSKLRLCPIGKLNLASVNWKKFSETVQGNFENPDVMVMAACITSSVIVASASDDFSLPLERIRHWFRRLTTLSSGAYGETLRAALDDGNQDFVVKVPTDDEASQSLFHEMMVGLMVTNHMRRLIPNFAYVYGGFHCSHPIPDSRGSQVMTFCNADDPIQYVIYENVTPAVRADKFFETCTRTEFFEVLLQTVFSLDMAFQRYDFEHGDLHPGNMLIRKLPVSKRVSIRYEFGGQTFYVNSMYIATLIDYGSSHFKDESGNYGFSGAIFMDVMPDVSFPMYDIFKFLWYSHKWSGNRLIETITNQLSEFFDPRDTFDNLAANKQLRGKEVFLPRTHPGVSWSFHDFFDYLNNNFSEDLLSVVSREPEGEVFGCWGRQCSSLSQVLDSIGYTTVGVPTDPFEFYDLYKSLTNEKAAFSLLARYNYYDGLTEINRRAYAIIVQINGALKNLPSTVDVTKPGQVNRYLTQLDNLGILINAVQSYASLIRVQHFMADVVSTFLGLSHSRLPADYLDGVRDVAEQNLAAVTQDLADFKKAEIKYTSAPTVNQNIKRILRRVTWYARLYEDWPNVIRSLDITNRNETTIKHIRQRLSNRRRQTVRPSSSE